MFFFAVRDPFAAQVPSHLHSEIEMSQLSKQLQRCPVRVFVQPLCVQESVVRISIHVVLSAAFRQSSYQVRSDSFFLYNSKAKVYLTHSSALTELEHFV